MARFGNATMAVLVVVAAVAVSFARAGRELQAPTNVAAGGVAVPILEVSDSDGLAPPAAAPCAGDNGGEIIEVVAPVADAAAPGGPQDDGIGLPYYVELP